MRAQRNIIVIGAGVAGLAAARYLASIGINVTVLEKNSYVGGRVRTTTNEKFKMDTGAGFMANFYTHTRDLIQELGLETEVIPIHSAQALFKDGRLHRIWPCLPPVSLRSKLMFWKVVYRLAKHWRELNIHAIEDAYRLDTSSITDYLLQEEHVELLEHFVRPIVHSLLYASPEKTSQAMMFLLLKAGLGMRRFTLRHGMGQFTEALANGLRVVKNGEVRRVEHNSLGGYSVVARIGEEESVLVADGIVCAVPATGVVSLFPWLTEKQVAFFKSISYSSTAVVSLGFRHRPLPHFDGVFFQMGREGKGSLAAVTSMAAKNPVQVPRGHELLQLFAAGPTCNALLKEDDSALCYRLIADFQRTRLMNDVERHALFYRVDRWPEAIPVFDVGHFGKLKAFADGGIETGHVVFAGDYIGGPFVEGAITSGLRAAQRLHTHFEARD
ncbi:MAG: hypothetical protein OJF52_000461 [Nitrospira sp.]|jgi:oxygen-dependent protoporphyrinogen oxidase|nr:MAG: hypothetical protein OJF52_000461 [Nitrospira sp.]